MLTALLTDLDHLEALDEVQSEFFSAPHPGRPSKWPGCRTG